MDLIIVESPHKASTISNFVGDNYTVIATKGHIKNLPKKDFGIIKTNGVYGGIWKIMEGKNKTLLSIKEIAKKANHIYIGTDDDREGERIAWDIVEYLNLKEYERIIFHEITKKAIIKAIANPLKVDKATVNAQIARRLIDRMLGYPISQMLRDYFKKNKIAPDNITRTMGIGRVSAAALAILVENEEKIINFEPKEYRKVRIDYFHDNIQFSVKSKILFDATQNEELKTFLSILKNKEYAHVVENYKRETKNYDPPPPLTTSWLLRGVSSQYGFLPEKTMKIAQELYEGVEINGKRVGLITYIRTDSYNISNSVVYDISGLVNDIMGEKYLYNSKRKYENKNNSAQEAHEAIRPTYFTKEYMPKNLKNILNEDQLKVYSYIYYRTIALQIKSSVYDVSSLVINIGNNKFYAYANKQEFDGWEKIGKFWKNETEETTEETAIPTTLFPGQELKPLNITDYPYQERVPPRYGVGRFITTLEKYQIARPSTISSVSSQLEKKGYIKIINSMQHPTDLGMKVYYFLKEYAPLLVSLEHAKEFEERLDEIAQGKTEANELISEYEQLKDDMAKALNYTFIENKKPDPWLIEKAKKIANEKGKILDQKTLDSYQELMNFVKNNTEKKRRIGLCPKCRKDVIEGEKNYYCKNRECDFVLWKKNFFSFFELYNHHITNNVLTKYIEVLLKYKKCYITELVSKKSGKTFSAYVVLDYNDKYKNWGLKFSFPKNNKEVNKKYIPEIDANDNSLTNKGIKAEKIKDENQDDSKTSNRQKIQFSKEALEIFQQENSEVENSQDLQDINPHEAKLKALELEKKKQQEELERLKNEKRLLIEQNKKDYLTRAYNKMTFDKDVALLLKKCPPEHYYMLFFIDIDHFKRVNDTYGHQAGDEVLKGVSNVIHNYIRNSEQKLSFYKYGGEEFVCLSYIKEKTEGMKIANEIREEIAKKEFLVKDEEGVEKNINCTVSIGVSFYENGEKIKDFVEKADEAMYRAKKNGRNRVEF